MNGLQRTDLTLIYKLLCTLPLRMMAIHEGFHYFQFGMFPRFIEQFFCLNSCQADGLFA